MKHRLPFYLIFIFFFLSYLIVSAQTYFPDTTFQELQVKINTAGLRSVIVQPDQKILIGGRMKYLNNSLSNNIMRLQANGSIDNTFHASTEIESVISMGLRSDGKIVACEMYNEANQSLLQFYLLKSSGELDSVYKTNIRCDYMEQYSFVLQNDRKMVLGVNTYGSPTSKGQVYRLLADGSIDPSFNTDALTMNSITALSVQKDGKILVTGQIEDPNGFIKRMIRINIDGSLDNSFNYYDYDYTLAVALQDDGKILVGHSGYNSTALSRLNSNGSADATFKVDSAYFDIYAIALQPDGKIVATVRYGKDWQLVRFLSDGSVDDTFHAGQGAEYPISALALQKDGKILASGAFETYNGTIQTALVRLNSNNGSVDNTFTFRIANNGEIEKLARQSDGKILVGGSFHTANTKDQSYLTRLLPNGEVDTQFKIGSALDEHANSTGGRIHAVTVQSDDKIWIGGYFTSFNSQKTTSLIRLKPDGSTDATFDVQSTPGYTYEILDIAVQPDKKALVGGIYFLHKDPSKSLLRFNTDGSIDASFNAEQAVPDGVGKILLQKDGKILVLKYEYLGYTSAARYIIRLNTNGTIDTTFIPYSVENEIHGIVLQPDERIVFNTFDNQGIYRIMRLNTNGSVDSTFHVSLSNKDYISNMTVQSDGKIWLAGSFPSVHQAVIRIQVNGIPDSSLVVKGLEQTESIQNLLVTGDDIFLSYDHAKVMKLTRQKPLTEEDPDNSLATLYPNPAVAGQFNIALPQGWNIEKAALYNNSGRQVPVTLNNTMGGYQVYTNNPPSGLYFLQILTTHGAFTKRIILK